MSSRPGRPEEVRSQPGLQTPESLLGQRVEPPSLDEQLAAYEAQRALLEDEYEEIDPSTAQGVYLLVAVLVGVLLAAAIAVPLGLLLTVW